MRCIPAASSPSPRSATGRCWAGWPRRPAPCSSRAATGATCAISSRASSRALQMGERVAFFPEGTTAAQGTVLPFHANLFEAAVDAKVTVQPYALRYLDAQRRAASGGRLHRRHDLRAEHDGDPVAAARSARELTCLAPIDAAGAHRRELAEQAHDAIGGALAAAAALSLLLSCRRACLYSGQSTCSSAAVVQADRGQLAAPDAAAVQANHVVAHQQAQRRPVAEHHRHVLRLRGPAGRTTAAGLSRPARRRFPSA